MSLKIALIERKKKRADSRADLHPGLFRTLSTFLLVFSLTFPSLRAAFQEALWGARPAGLAGAYTALADDSNAPAYNPAGIVFMNHHELTLMYARLFTGLDLNVGDETSDLGLGFLSFVPQIKNKKYGSFAFSWTNFIASKLLREDSFSLTYANAYHFRHNGAHPILAYGANIKLLRRSFSTGSRTSNDPVFSGDRAAEAVTFDLGLVARPDWDILPGLKIGLAAQNVTEPDMGLKGSDRVPARYSLGIAYQDRDFRLINPSVDVSRREGRELVTLGWESWLAKDAFAIRLGGNKDQLGGGLGYQFRLFRHSVMRIDYSLMWPMNVEGTNGSHRFSITTTF